mgnify:CR=1 FL=1
MALNTLKDVYIDQLQDIYSADRQSLEATKKLHERASDPQLKAALKEQLFKQLPCVNKEPDSKTLYFAGTDTPSGHTDSDCYGFLAGPGGTAFCSLLDFGTGASAQSPHCPGPAHVLLP